MRWAMAILIGACMTYSASAEAQTTKPSPSEVKAAYSGAVMQMRNPRGQPMKFEFMRGGSLKVAFNAGGIPRSMSGKWWVKPTSQICLEFDTQVGPRGSCRVTEKEKGRIYSLDPTGNRAHEGLPIRK